MNFCLDLKQHAAKIINYEKKRNDTIKKIKNINREQNVYYICKKGFSTDDKIKNAIK